MKCPGCHTDASKVRSLIPEIVYGRLQVECPVCAFINPIGIDAEGNMYFTSPQTSKPIAETDGTECICKHGVQATDCPVHPLSWGKND